MLYFRSYTDWFYFSYPKGRRTVGVQVSCSTELLEIPARTVTTQTGGDVLVIDDPQEDFEIELDETDVELLLSTADGTPDSTSIHTGSIASTEQGTRATLHVKPKTIQAPMSVKGHGKIKLKGFNKSALESETVQDKETDMLSLDAETCSKGDRFSELHGNSGQLDLHDDLSLTMESSCDRENLHHIETTELKPKGTELPDNETTEMKPKGTELPDNETTEVEPIPEGVELHENELEEMEPIAEVTELHEDPEAELNNGRYTDDTSLLEGDINDQQHWEIDAEGTESQNSDLMEVETLELHDEHSNALEPQADDAKLHGEGYRDSEVEHGEVEHGEGEHGEGEHGEGEHGEGEHGEGEHGEGEHGEGEHPEVEHGEGEHPEGEHGEGEHGEGEHPEGEHGEGEHPEVEHGEGEHPEVEHGEGEHPEVEHERENMERENMELRVVPYQEDMSSKTNHSQGKRRKRRNIKIIEP